MYFSLQIDKLKFLLLLCIIISFGCGNNNSKNQDVIGINKPGTFGYDSAFLQKFHQDMIVLGKDDSREKLIVLPAYQGRVMTSTAEGDTGRSFGWINHELISSGKLTPHMNAFGGEDRFWLGPEGGQFSVYFEKGKAFNFENWQVPKELDTEPFDMKSFNDNEVRLEKQIHLVNYSGNVFDVHVNRNISLINRDSTGQFLGALPGDLSMVGFQTENIITNTGNRKWDVKTGMLSVWILSMLNANDHTTIIVPYKEGNESALGKIVTDDYFGKIPPDRLQVENGVIRLKADGNYRSKIGISPKRAIPMAGSFDTLNNVLTIIQFTLPSNNNLYVNSLWKLQEDPFGGDAVNAYNDGPIDGKQMGRFYELESSSPAAALAPGQSLTQIQRIFHITGSRSSLNQLVDRLLLHQRP